MEKFNINSGSLGLNRSYEIALKDSYDKPISIGVKDIDETIKYYFDNVLKPAVIVNGKKTKVPVIYGSTEKWNAVQRNGFYRDENGKIVAPLIMFRRDSITHNRTVGNKLDGNKAKNVAIISKKYSRRNVYDNFYLLNKKQPQQEYQISVIPDYVTIQYSCILFTDQIYQNNKLIEPILFASNAYWGDPRKYIFRTSITNFQNQSQVVQGQDRLIKTELKLTLNGYLIPNSINKDIAVAASKFYNISTVIFNPEVEFTSAIRTAPRVLPITSVRFDTTFITFDSTSFTFDNQT